MAHRTGCHVAWASILLLGAITVQARDLAFEDRIRCQEAIERVQHHHRIEVTLPFEEALPREMLEGKIVDYLKQSAALEEIWRTPLSAELLERELSRMALRTRSPERLLELFTALGNDAFLVQECLVRPVLANRLARELYAFDPRLHAEARDEAERLGADLLRLGAEAFEADQRRTVVEFVERGSTGSATLPDRGRHTIAVSREELERTRTELRNRPGGIGALQEERHAFVIRALLGDRPRQVRIAQFVVAKRPWDRWWEEACATFDASSVSATATDRSDLPEVRLSGGQDVETRGTGSCLPNDTWINGSLDDGPNAASGHTAVWTGTEMIVWGANFGNRGERYDPATDTWTPTSTIGAPVARSRHTAVWTGTEMIVWGGFRFGYLGTGGRYDPATDTWTPTSTTAAPEARERHAAVWTGSQMVVWGGISDSSSALDTGGRYDPTTDTWTAISTLAAPEGRREPTAVATGSAVIVWGGTAVNGFPLDTGGRYDPASDTWQPTSVTNAPQRRTGHVAVWTGTEMIVWGGAGFGALQDTGGRYDPATDNWVATSSVDAPSGRYDHVAVWTGTEMIVWGGSVGGVSSYTDTGGRYDPAMDSWAATSIIAAPGDRRGHTAVWTGAEMIVWGGASGVSLNSGGRYVPGTDSWTPTFRTLGPGGHRNHTAVWTGAEMIVWGGLGDTLGTLDTGGRYDPATDSWASTSLTGVPEGRYTHTAVWTGNRMIVWGGRVDSGPLASGGRYDPVTDTWASTATANAPVSRYAHTIVWTGREMIVWGGTGVGPGYFDTGGRYDPETDSWVATSAVGAPAGRGFHTAVWTGDEMIVWSGSGATPGTGGRYDPATDQWSPTSTTGVPQPTNIAVWTGTAMLVWGSSSGSAGLYDPASDTWTPASGGLVAVANPAVAWTGEVMIAWGGYGVTQQYLDIGQRYDPGTNTWAVTSSTGAPLAREAATAVWTGNLMIVWGGTTNGGGFDTGGRYALDPPILTDTPELAARRIGGDRLLFWTPLAAASGYDVVRGDLTTLRATGGDFTASLLGCGADNLGTTSLPFSDPAGPGADYYLVRPLNCVGNGTYDSGAGSQVGQRDAEIGAAVGSCP